MPGSRAALTTTTRLTLTLLGTAMVMSGCGGGSSPDRSDAADELADVAPGTIVFRRYLDATNTRAALFTMSSHGEGERRITKPPADAVDTLPDWSPDGQQIAFSREFQDKPYEVHVVGADGAGETVLDPGCLPGIKDKKICEEANPSWSPDGTLGFDWAGGTLSMVRGEETIEVAGIGTAKPDGSGATLLTQNDRPTKSEDKAAMWSPDGKRLGFIRLNISAKPLDGSAVFVADADGSNARRITPWVLGADDPAWSPDGSLISFRSEPDPENEFVGDLYTVRPDGSGVTKIVDGRGKQVLGSSFSPDSKWIVFAMTGKGELPDLYVTRRDGSDLSPLTRTPEWESAPDWGPR